jgi:CDP-paratose 2-epimerase
MKILITGICGFVGHALAHSLLQSIEGCKLFGIDNFIRPGSETNRASLKAKGVRILHGDIRCPSDLESLPAVDWVIDAAANPSVLAGVDGQTSSRQLIEHNLGGTINLLEYCRRAQAGFILLSTSRVYHITALAEMPVEIVNGAFQPTAFPSGVSAEGVAETYSTAAPVSLYGASKVASEILALEYGATYDLPVWINRCGVLAGAGQFGRPDQGIFSYWLHTWKQRRPLKYIGFDAQGHQVRDCLHPDDLADLLRCQLRETGDSIKPRIINVSGGRVGSRSLRQISDWCRERWGEHTVSPDPLPRRFDIPWMVLDPRLAQNTWNWAPVRSPESIFEEIARHAEADPAWLDTSAPL